jgi:hypothetical protein
MEPTYNWVMYQSNLPWLRLDLEAPAREILEEAKKVVVHAVDRVAPQNDVTYQYPANYGVGWTSIGLHAISSTKIGHSSQYGFKSEDEAPYVWTEIADLCPKTVEFVKSIPAKKLYRVRFMRLAAGGRIEPHKDTLDKGLTRLSVAIRFPKKCHFMIQDYLIPFADGQVFLIDKSMYHRVDNPSDEDRIQLVIEGVHDGVPEWEDLVMRSYPKRDRDPILRLG